MAADIHAVALVAHGAGDAADLVAGLEDDRLNLRLPLQLKRRRQSGRSRADDDRSTFLHATMVVPSCESCQFLHESGFAQPGGEFAPSHSTDFPFQSFGISGLSLRSVAGAILVWVGRAG